MNLKYCFILLGMIFSSCSLNTKEDSNQEQDNLNLIVEVVKPQIIKISLKPDFILPGRIYSLTLLHADTPIDFPLPVATSEDKDKVITIALEETDNNQLTSAFYKKGLISSANNKLEFENPFLDHPVRDVNGLPVGSQATGILYLMSKNTGRGVELTPQGEGKILLNKDGEYEFFIYLNTQVKSWKILMGIVHVDIFNPSLDSPTLTPIFNIFEPHSVRK